MKKILFFIAMGLSSAGLFAQCSVGDAPTQYPSGTFTPNVGTFTVVDACIAGGEYNLHNVVAGNTYQWSYCVADGGDYFYDTQLTLFDNSNNAFLAYNDDACGVGSKITWTATFTGVVRLVTTEYDCTQNFDCATLVSRQVVSCVQNPGTYIIEPEPCLQDVNGGCNMLNPAYTPIACGDTIFGTVYHDGITRDTDWYTFTLGQSATVTATLTASFEGLLILADASNCNAPLVLTSATAPACTPTTISLAMNAGTWILFVAPTFNDLVPCGPVSEYVLSFSYTNPPVTITPVGPLCSNGSSVTLAGSPSGGTFSGPGVVGNTFDPAVAGVGTHTITYALQGACAGSATAQIVVNQGANTTITPVAPVCATDPVFTFAAADPGGTWSGTGITNPSTGDFDPSVAGVGTHTITYTIGGTCGGSSTTSIIVNALADATILPAGPFCTADQSVNLSTVVPGGTFSGTGITNSSLGTFDPAVAGAGTHVVTYTISSGCANSGTATIIVNTSPDANFTMPVAICEDDSPITPVPTTSGGTFSGTGISGGTFDPAISGPGSFTVTYTISANGCTSTSSQTVNVDPLPVASFTSSGNPNPLVTFNNTSTNGNTYAWDFGDGQTSSQQNPTHTYQSTGNYTVTLIVTNNCGSDTSTRVIDIVLGSINEEGNGASVSLFPNPAGEMLKVNLVGISGDYTLEILDMNGKVLSANVFQAQNNASEVVLNIAHLPAATYLVRIAHQTGMITKQVVKL